MMQHQNVPCQWQDTNSSISLAITLHDWGFWLQSALSRQSSGIRHRHGILDSHRRSQWSWQINLFETSHGSEMILDFRKKNYSRNSILEQNCLSFTRQVWSSWILEKSDHESETESVFMYSFCKNNENKKMKSAKLIDFYKI